MPFLKPRSGPTLALAVGAWAAAAAAQPIPDTAPPESAPSAAPSFAFGFGAASDGFFRGVSRTADRPQAFGSMEASIGQAYAGAWAANAAFRQSGPARNGAEVDVYGGWRPEFRGYSLDFGAQYDVFAGQPAGAGLDYAELYAKVSRTIGPLTGRLGLHWSPAFAVRRGQAWYAEAGADYAITRDWTISAGVGRQTGRPTIVGGGDYLNWNAAVSRAIGPNLALDLRYSDTDGHRYGQAWDTRVIGAIRASF
jgi:uncharacterized protein (TIGR02001 family)